MADIFCSENSNQFLNMNDQYKKIFLQTMAYMAYLDGKFDSYEMKCIKKLAQQLNFSIDEKIIRKKSETKIIEGLKEIKERHIALELIKELCLLGHADSNLSEEEVLFVGHAGQAMGIEIEKIEQISDWVVDQIILREKGKFIMEDC